MRGNWIRMWTLLTCVYLAGSVHASFINFEDLGISSGGALNPGTGVSIITGGFNYSPGPNNASGFNDLHIGNAVSGWSYNGTTVGISHDDVVLTKVGGGTFSISRFDFAGFPNNAERAFSVTGFRADASTITQNFTPDGLVDGIGGAVDFQTFNFVGNWTNLVSVTWNHTGAGTSQGLFGLDNIEVDAIVDVPVPQGAYLMSIGLMCVGALRLRRRFVPRQA